MQTETIHSTVSLVLRGSAVNRLELSRLMAAAVINQEFCQLLLQDPGLALCNGFQGETFLFTKEERDLILSIRADSLPELADQLIRSMIEHTPIQTTHPIQPAEILGF